MCIETGPDMALAVLADRLAFDILLTMYFLMDRKVSSRPGYFYFEHNFSHS